jgi:hypothetical protein
MRLWIQSGQLRAVHECRHARHDQQPRDEPAAHERTPGAEPTGSRAVGQYQANACPQHAERRAGDEREPGELAVRTAQVGADIEGIGESQGQDAPDHDEGQRSQSPEAA